MLLTPVTDELKTKPLLNKGFVKVRDATLDSDVIAWLCGDSYGRVKMVGLAADFYISTYVKDVAAKRTMGQEGFDPLTDGDCFISEDNSLTAWLASVNDATTKNLKWLDSFMFTYLCAAVAGELRHSVNVDSVNKALRKKLTQFGILGSDQQNDLSRGAVQKRFLTSLQASQLHTYLELAVTCFDSPKWPSSYGGPRWAEIAKTGLQRYEKQIDATSFIDRVFDLKHNGGPMFDKNKAVDNTKLQEFLDHKFLVKNDYEWDYWLKYCSSAINKFLRSAKEKKCWNGCEAPFTPFVPVETETIKKQEPENNFELPSWAKKPAIDFGFPPPKTKPTQPSGQYLAYPNLNSTQSTECSHLTLDTLAIPTKV